jgi:hypothetical protein
MKRNFLIVLVLGLTPLFFSCLGDHNKAPSKGVNLDNTRIYGPSRTADPLQLANQYEDNPENLTRAQAIREKFFPR